MKRQFYTARQVAAELQVRPQTVREMILLGDLDADWMD